MFVIDGDVEVGVIWTTLFGIVTVCATGIVACDAISPMMICALFTLTSFVAASTLAAGAVCPSSEPTRRTDMPESFSRFSDSFWSAIAIRTAWSRFLPYAARSPVNGSTVPIRSWNDGAGRTLSPRSTLAAAPPAVSAIPSAAASASAPRARMLIAPPFLSTGADSTPGAASAEVREDALAEQPHAALRRQPLRRAELDAMRARGVERLRLVRDLLGRAREREPVEQVVGDELAGRAPV